MALKKEFFIILFFVICGEPKMPASCCKEDTVKKVPSRNQVAPNDFTRDQALRSNSVASSRSSSSGSSCSGCCTDNAHGRVKITNSMALWNAVRNGQITMA